MISGANVGSITWNALTGQSVVNVSASKPEALTAASKRSELDQSHLPDDKAELSDADRMAIQEEKANKKLKAFYAAGTVFDSTIRTLGSMGNFWGLINGVMSGGVTGWTAVWAGCGSALTVTDSAFQVKMAAVNRNLPAAIEGSFGMVQGMGVMLMAMGLGRIPAVVAAGALAGKTVYGMYRAAKAEKEKEEQQKAGEAEKEAAKQAKQQPSVPAEPKPVEPSKPAVEQPKAPVTT